MAQIVRQSHHMAVGEYIKRYHRLYPKLNLQCRVIEATQLLKVTRDVGSDTQKATVFKMLNNIKWIQLGCNCTDDNCSQIVPNEGCYCRFNESLDCKGLYAFATDGLRHFYPPGFRP
jgi:hypothetical protein